MISVTNKQSTKTRTISNLSTGDIIGCIGAALGIPGGALGLRTGSLVTAKTGLQIRVSPKTQLQVYTLKHIIS